MMTDTELLRDYVTTGSGAAFTALVERHINLVYSAARRQVRDAHLADDITQAVFIILARKAASIRNPAMLGAWLLNSTRHTACNAIRLERCRRRHEHEAAIMKAAQEQYEGETAQAVANIEGVVDELLSRLPQRDRGPLVLRYLQGKSVNDVAAALNISELAAQKRLGRALARLRDLFARNGTATAADALERGLASQALLVAPPALARLAGAGAITKASGGGAALARFTVRNLFWAKIQTIAFGLVASCVAIGVVTTVAVDSMPASGAAATQAAPPNPPAAAIQQPPATVAASDFPPVIIANDDFHTGGPAGLYANEIDPTVRRTPDSAPAAHIKSLVPRIPADGVYTDFSKILVHRTFVGPLTKFRGRRIRVSGWIKTRDVRECAGIRMYAYGDAGEMEVIDEQWCTHPIRGTTDWQKYEIVKDIPQAATRIVFGPVLFCTGEIWADDFEAQIVSKDVPLTDDQDWTLFTPLSGRYTATVDNSQQHDGHATTLLQSLTVPRGGWVQYEHFELHPNQEFIGHRIRVTAWVKSSGVSGVSGLNIFVCGPWDLQLATDGQVGHRPIIGTHDWQQISAEADVPAAAQRLKWGFTLNARGKVWIDLDSIEVSLADTEPAPQLAPAP